MGRSGLLLLPIVSLVFIAVLEEGTGYQVGNNPFRRAEVLDPDGLYLLEWEVDWDRKRVTFNVTVATRGWVGFGLANNGTIQAGADMVIGGVGQNGQIYFSDRHIESGRGGDVPILDRRQDWTVHSAWERAHTFLSFSRAFDTCDSEDYAITLNKVTLLWAYGRSDNEDGYNPENRGFFHTHLLDPDYAPELVQNSIGAAPTIITQNRNEHIPEDTKIWSVRRSLTLPVNHTNYICGFHKGPRLQRKHHWIGFDIQFPNEESRIRTHHVMFYRCNPPPDLGFSARELFEPHLSNPGTACYILRRLSENLRSPYQYCTEFYFEWAIGAKAFFMPNNVGVPMGESPDEYFMIQMHYDNPQQERGISVDARLDFFYTSQLRPNDGGMFGLIHDLPGLPETMLVPPNTMDHRVFTHCSPECTQRITPSSGITIMALTLHSHNAGKGIRLRHFRGGRELPWILYDDNFDNWVQPFRHLRNGVKILPGDQLTIECHYSTNETSSLSGFSTRQEMCNTFFLYYDRVTDHSFCGSGINSQRERERFLGVRNVSWIEEELDWIVNTPRRLAGLTVTQVSDSFVDWTPERRNELQRFHVTHPQTGRCVKEAHQRTLAELLSSPQLPVGVPPSGPLSTPEEYIGPVSFPFHATPYYPPSSSCRRNAIG